MRTGGLIMRTRATVLTILGTVVAAWLVAAGGSVGHAAGDALLSGRITSASGEKMEGVTVSARQLGKTFTTSVFTDAAGEYYFPHLEQGKYKVWAQAVGYDAAILEDLTVASAVHREDLVLKPLQNFELQLRGDEWVASLPEDTAQDRKMKEVFRMNCYGGCHSPSQAFKDRYDEKGWKAIINVMSRINTPGTYSTSEERNVQPVLHYFKDDLAAYLAKVRGPVPYPLKLKPRPRPKGEETLAVFREYDSPVPGFGVPLYNDGSLWQLGPANKTDLKNMGSLRAAVDFDGNPWFTGPGRSYRSFAKIDWKTGKLTSYKVPGEEFGEVDGVGEIFTDAEGIVWTRTDDRLVRVDRSGKMETIKQPDRSTVPPASRLASSSGRKVRVWYDDRQPLTCSNGLCKTPPILLWMYEPSTKQWAVYENPPAPPGVQAFSSVYNVTSGGDSEGNGWWAQFGTDVMVKADGKTGEIVTIKLPGRINPAWDLFTGDDRKIFEMAGGAEPHGRGMPIQHSIRMVGAGPGPTDSAWGVGWFSSELIRVNIHTNKVTVYKPPLTDCGAYQTVVDPQGRVWTICQSADYLWRFDPKTEQFARFDLPLLNVEAHGMGVAPVLIDGKVRVVVPSWTNSKTIIMDVRTRDDIQALKAEAQRASR